MNINCPKCQAIYKVTAQHVGVQVECRKCGAALVVKADGLHLANEAELNVESDLPRERPRSRRAMMSRSSLSGLDILSDVPTWFFAAGTFLVILFLFFPLIDVAKIVSRNNAIECGEQREKRLDQALKNKVDRKSEDTEMRQKDNEKWLKEKEKLQESVHDAQNSAQTSLYWYRYGMLFGFLLLTVGSLGYLSPSQPTIRRIIGAIVLLAIVVTTVLVTIADSTKATLLR